MLGMLKMFGIKPDQLIMQAEEMALKKWVDLQAEAGSKLIAVAFPDDTGTHFTACLYKAGEGGEMELWKSFPLKNIPEILENLQNDVRENSNKGLAEIAIGNDQPGADNGSENNSIGSGNE